MLVSGAVDYGMMLNRARGASASTWIEIGFARMSMVMFGTALRTLQPQPARANHTDKSHHSFILMT